MFQKIIVTLFQSESDPVETEHIPAYQIHDSPAPPPGASSAFSIKAVQTFFKTNNLNIIYLPVYPDPVNLVVLYLYKTTMLNSNRLTGRRQTKKITILNDIPCSSMWRVCTTWMTDCKGSFTRNTREKSLSYFEEIHLQLGRYQFQKGSVTERLERCNCNSEAPTSSPALTGSWICSQ